ncbi:hypothetical protein [Mixta calida]|uniref:hypothetical protein n=2 Tax=Mixta TaxID=2100764 RepID=UPI00053607BD|nr:hypothetical protein [Mixta calida]AIX74179.1 hypothetical protein PSNIH2_10575 [Pantoea sp. PSNIH2]POU51576.1 hypothetical protein C3380_02310 [Pantoea sp. PSNIH5]POU69370.1 hypothetical protein C3374_05180 [Pantoea sp. PSNIH4]POY69459.1 hypothetical protein C3402_02590 [Pantoea sp. PSNIH3]MDU4288022.1 hypothetical protein [Mixta calida]
MLRSALPVLSAVLFPAMLMADCLPADMVLFSQLAYMNRTPTLWQIAGNSPYRTDNLYNDFGIKYAGQCALIENELDVNFSVYGLTYYPYRHVEKFEQDDNRLRGIINQLSFSYRVAKALRVEAGKLKNPVGLFYLKSPAVLLNNYYAGFKATRIYDPLMKQIYPETSWAIKLASDSTDYSWSLTAVPKLTHIDKRYEASSNWSVTERANASERYLFSYTDYRLAAHTPAVNLAIGETKSIAVSDSFHYTPQWVFNAEFAWHGKEQWRHFNVDNAESVQNYRFPTSLYRLAEKNGLELALGGQYTTDHFSVLGLEYYYQSEGYSSSEWRKQRKFIDFLNKTTPYATLNQAFDSYKYLMAAEINNIANKGSLQGKHYINGYASFMMADSSTLQPYVVLNLQDQSAMWGVNYNRPLAQSDGKMEFYSGIYHAQGSKYSEFGLFGKTVGVYSGMKYYF